MKKTLKSLLAILIVFAIIATPLLAVFAEEGGDEGGGNVGDPPAETITVTYYNGDSLYYTDTNYTGTIITNYPAPPADRVFRHWVIKDAMISGNYYPGASATFEQDTILVAVFADKASGSDGIYAVKDGKTEFEFEYNGAPQSVKFSAAQPGNDYEQDKLDDGWFMFDIWYTIPFAYWYIDINGLTAGGTQAGTYLTPKSGQEAVDTWATFTRVEDRYADIAPGIVRIYYTIKYDMNGGEGEIETQKIYEESANAQSSPATLSEDVPTKEGATFKGWATDKDATRAEYQPGETIEISENKVLYAVWEVPEVPNPKTGFNSDTLMFLMVMFMAMTEIAVIRSLRRRNAN